MIWKIVISANFFFSTTVLDVIGISDDLRRLEILAR